MARFKLKKDKKFIVYRAWCKPSETEKEKAFGYEIYAYSSNELSVKNLCENPGYVTKSEYGWAAEEGLPILYYEEI